MVIQTLLGDWLSNGEQEIVEEHISNSFTLELDMEDGYRVSGRAIKPLALLFMVVVKSIVRR